MTARPAYGPWADLRIGEQFEVRSTRLPVTALARRVRAAAYQWQHRLPGRAFRVVERPESVVVLRIA